MTNIELQRHYKTVKIYDELQAVMVNSYKSLKTTKDNRNELRRSRVLKHLDKQFYNHISDYGFFINIHEILDDLERLKKVSIDLEKYDITYEIDYWYKKLSNL